MPMSIILKPITVLVLCVTAISAQAAILSDSSEQRIQVRPVNSYQNAEAVRNDSSQRAGVTMLSELGWSNRASRSDKGDGLYSDPMQGLIAQKQSEFQIDARLSIEESKRVQLNKTPKYRTTYGDAYNDKDSYSGANTAFNDYTSMDFNIWLNSNSYRASQIANFQNYLGTRIGARNIPPISQLLTTARSWDKCGYEPYQLPPQELWSSMVPTLRLYTELKYQGILPAGTEIRSVYRSPGLNSCAGGASGSRHMTANAIDIWVPEYQDNPWQLSTMQDSLCQFWQYQGEAHNFGLGLYSTGAIHLDTDGYRKWGFNNTRSGSFCRY